LILDVAIVGCGKIADQHAEHISFINGSRLVGVCDQEPLMARQLAERSRISYFTSDIDELLNKCRPNVVHITTPPHTHFTLAKKCIENGCHVYVEKPFTLNLDEAEKLVELASIKDVRLTVGHNLQFTPAMIKMREMIKEGYLGGDPVHMESYFCYNFSDSKYAKVMLGDQKHWVRQLPGNLLHNIISHGISKIAEHLKSDEPEIVAKGYTSPMLKSIGENKITDELRVILNEDNCSAFFTFSSQINPVLHNFRIYGPHNGLEIDDDKQILVRLSGKVYKSYLEMFWPPLNFSRQYMANFVRNLKSFITFKLLNDSGMRNLIKAFYRSIRKDLPDPIPTREILLTTKIMEKIFNQISQ